MADTSLSIRLKAVDDGAIANINKVEFAFSGLTIGTAALSAALKGLNQVTDSSFGNFVLGTQNAEKLSGAIARLSDVNSKALKTFSALSDVAFLGGQTLTLLKGAQDATAVFTRIPQTFDLLRASGVSSRSIEDFYTLTDAIKSSEASVEQFAVNAVEQLSRFEQAAARVGTILRSSVNFDVGGNALRASQKEQLKNAFQVQEIVNKQINNAVTSTEALTGQYEVLSSGFTKTAESQKVLTSGLKLIGIAQAGGAPASPTDTLQLLVKTLNAYELGASESAKVSAILNATVDAGITTIQELSLGFGQTAKTAKTANVGLVDLASSTAVLTGQGINTANALTGLQRTFGTIIGKTPEAEKALAKLSLNGQKIRFDQAEVQAKGFTQALLDLNKAAGGNAQILQEIFPEEFAFRTVLALLAQDGQKLASTTASIGSVTANSLDEVFKIATGDRVNRFQQIVNRFQELIIKVAASVAPVFEPGIGVLEKIASAFNNLPEPAKQAIGQFIVFQLTARATTSAVGILFQTLLSLAGSYFQVRLVSLALSGQLGKELAVIRELIAQRKGLASVALQLFGIDQRYRLGVQATTEAIEKQNIVTKAVAATRTKAGEIFNRNVAGFSGQNLDAAKDAGRHFVDKSRQAFHEGIKSARNIGLGLTESAGVIVTPQILGPDGKSLSQTGINRVQQEVAKVGDAVGDALAQAKQKITTSVADVDTSALIATTAQQAKDKANAAYQGIKQRAEQAKVALAGEAAATAAATTATTSHAVALAADELAERGIAQTRIFGRTVLFSTLGPLGAINSLLATEISLKTVAAGATRTFAIAQGTAATTAKLLEIALKAPITGITALGKAAGGFVSQGISGLTGTLGPIAPLLAVSGLAVFAFREELFGLRKASNEAANGLAEVLKKDSELRKQFGTERRLIEFKAELTPEGGATPEKIETRLEQLRLSGNLTTGQFNQLRETLAKVGAQGKLTADGLNEFRAQLEAIRQGAQGKPEQGVFDKIGGAVAGTPGAIATGTDYVLDVFAAALSRPLEFFNPATSGQAREAITTSREADNLIKNFSQVGIAIESTGTQSLATAEKIAQYRKGLGLTAEANEKIRVGAKLTTQELEREEQVFKSQSVINENLIAGVEKDIAQQRKLLESVKDPTLKASLEERINLLEVERSTLEKRNEALKVGREEFVKYYTDTLPNLKRALTETTNLQQSLTNAQTAFRQPFRLDAAGKATPFLKDITTLRNEAAQYVAQVQEAYQGAAIGEAEAIKRLQEARDNQIKLPDGTAGFRLSQSDRITATQQIVELRQTASKGRTADINLDIERAKLAQQQRVKSEEDTQKRIVLLQIQATKEALAQKELEVREYAKFPVRRNQLEREAAALRIQIQQQEAAEVLRQLERQRARRQEAINIEIEQVRALQAERVIGTEAAERQISQLQIKAARERLNNLIEDYNKSGRTSFELSQKIAIARAQLRQQEAAEVERLFNLEQERQKRLLANAAQAQTLTLQGRGQAVEGQSKDLELRSSLLSSINQLQNVQAEAVEAQLNNQLKLTGDTQRRAQIERQIAENRLQTLAVTQQQERTTLAIQTQTNRLQLQREQIQLRIQKIESDRNLAELNLELIRARRERRTPEEIKAIELQIRATNQQAGVLTEQEQRLERSRTQQEQIAENSRKELEIKQRTATINAKIETKLANQREIQAGIEKAARDIELAAQASQISGQIQLNQSEALVKVYDQQKTSCRRVRI
ncbi:phage tail tape measure protein [Nostocales cyanobacterium HT-58-2]|nr:phage tail tape measure protein [Nostocales cyanobacterium HT-58-2]